MILKTRVRKLGNIESYVGLPVTDLPFTYNPVENQKVRAIGIINEAVELEDSYELSIKIWDRFVTQGIEYENERPASFTICFK